MFVPRPMSAPAVTSDVVSSLAAFRGATRELGAVDWARPTDCPGWDVHDVVAHVVTFEAFLDGEPAPEVDPEGTDVADPHVRNEIGRLNEAWVASWRGRPPRDLLDGMDDLVQRRTRELAEVDDEDLAVVGWSPVGEVARSRFLQIRVLDIWFHEQDIREATGRPARSDRDVVERVVSELTHGLAFVVARRAGASDGTRVRFAVDPDDGADPIVLDIEVVDGRGKVSSAETPSPTATIAAELGAFGRLVGGRRPPEAMLDSGRVSLDGDVELGRRVVEHLGFMI
ncbi:MAG TPA: maleylpyruvate isomerase family mycothiol-dependent enzyme [Microthrixaceae bacterium]|nr:maleylpyruvate isomerase family mycothiol-dependent enzyme [Microthrixaceae bacterium]